MRIFFLSVNSSFTVAAAILLTWSLAARPAAAQIPADDAAGSTFLFAQSANTPLRQMQAAEQRRDQLENLLSDDVTPAPAVPVPQTLSGQERQNQIDNLLSDDVPQSPDTSQPLGDDILKRLEALEKGQSSSKSKSSRPTMNWTGRIQADYWAFPGQSAGEDAFENGDPFDAIDDRFLFRRLRIGVAGTISDNMLYKLEVDFNDPNNPQLKDNFIGWENLPFFQTVLVGNQKRPYGLDAIESSRFTTFLERPAIVEAFTADSRRFGIASYGFTEDLRYNWRFGGFMGRDLQSIGTVTATPDAGDYQAEFAGRLAQTVYYEDDGRNYLHLATAGTVASTDGNASSEFSTARFRSRPEARTSGRWLDTGVIAGAQDYQLTGLEAVFNQGPLQIAGEWMNTWVHREGFQDVSFHGGYVYIAYFLTGEHVPWDRETAQLERVKPFRNFYWSKDALENPPGPGAWQVAIRYSYADLTDADILGGIESNMTLGLNWYWNPYSRLQFNYVYGRIHDRTPISGFSEGEYHILGTRVAVDF